MPNREAHIKPCYVLETPKAQNATYAKISGDEANAKMGNQQVTQFEIGWIAGFIDGEGYIGISMYKNKSKSKSGKSVKVELHVCNTDEEMINKYMNIVHKIGINPYLSKKKHKGVKKDVYKAVIHRMAPLYKLLVVIMPHLTGAKKERALLINEFLESRLEKINIAAGTSIPYTEKEVDLIQKSLKLQKRGTSETTRKAELLAYQRTSLDSIEKRCKMAEAILKLHHEGKNQVEIARAIGKTSNSSGFVGSWIRRLKNNDTVIQKLGYFPMYSDDIVRPFVKA